MASHCLRGKTQLRTRFVGGRVVKEGCFEEIVSELSHVGNRGVICAKKEDLT